MSLSGKLFILFCSFIIVLKPSIVMNITTPQGAYLCPETLDSNQEYLLQIVGKNVDSLSSIVIQGLDQWYASQQASYTTINTINGTTERSCQLTYRIKAKKEGNFTLGPAIQQASTSAIQSNILQGVLVAGSKNNHVHEDESQEIFLKMSVDYSPCYIQQTLMLTLKLYIPLSMNIAECSTPVSTHDRSLQFCLIKQYSTENYHCIEWRAPITPQQSGKLTILPAQVQYMVQPSLNHGSLMQAALRGFGFGAQQKTISSNKINIEVQSLPEGVGIIDAIGDFKDFYAHVSDETLCMHDALSYTLRLEGAQEVQLLSHPTLREIDDFKVHVSESSSTESSKTFQYILQPLKEGSLKVGAQKFRFLNPKSGSVITLSTQAYTISVLPVVVPPNNNEQHQNSPLVLVDHSWHYVPPASIRPIHLIICLLLLNTIVIIVKCRRQLLERFLRLSCLRKNYALARYKRALHAYEGTHPEQLECMLKLFIKNYHGMSYEPTTQQCYEFANFFSEKYSEWCWFIDQLSAARYSFCTQHRALQLKETSLVWLRLIKERV